MLRLTRLVRIATKPVQFQASSFYKQTANVCSVCASIIRKAQEQNAREGPEKTWQQSHHHQHLVLPPRRHLQQTTHVGTPNHAPTRDFDINTHWGYTGKYGVDSWSKYFPPCDGSNQSPVDLSESAMNVDKKLTHFTFVNFDTNNFALSLTNNGHSAQASYSSGDLRVSGGGLSSEYVVEQFHFHWGEDNAIGSEHTINGQYFPLEMHVVTYKRDYGTLAKAVAADRSDGLAVLGVFFEVENADNKNFSKLVEALKEIRSPHSSYPLSSQALMPLLPKNKNHYYRYSGSLTTPPCNEVVTWTLFKETVAISSGQLNAFRSLETTDDSGTLVKLVNNFRPVQPLNGRKVKKNF